MGGKKLLPDDMLLGDGALKAWANEGRDCVAMTGVIEGRLPKPKVRIRTALECGWWWYEGDDGY
jgi:hypothetical protein